MSSKNIEEIKKMFEKADLDIMQAEQDLNYFEGFVNSFEQINRAIHELEDFYFGETFSENLTRLRKEVPDENYNSSGEDSIWNLHVGFNSLKLELLKKLSDELYRNISV